ncbi:PREDICTED: G0/G1 switch protein 2-like [Cyprinodon variegatus]|uniref:G0/G1 switch protein 2-like n=1 Tax=Cyprinodon variegatus TaxID=28743 RepID=UPI0007426A07|nr:PREDICTED: G0/G1 switch protein 2-like [Cyprinodon variegatus]
MENINDIIPFAKDMLRQRPTSSMLKIYMLGSTLAILGMVGGMVEMILLPFLKDRTIEEELAELLFEKKTRNSSICTEAEEVIRAILSEAKVKHPGTGSQRSLANRLHAS